MKMDQENKMKILIVDDRPENLLVLENLLDDMALNILKAQSGNEALGLMLEHEFALVLMDVQMPGMDGFETAELMRGSERTKHIPIIFVTALSKNLKCMFRGYEVGAVDYLFKPIEPIILKSKVNVFIEFHRQKEMLKTQAQKLEEKIEALIALREENGELEHLSAHDYLTGIPNRRSLNSFLDMEWGRSLRKKASMSAMMIDIDHFKEYNDNYGHLQGDECLKHVSDAIVSSVNRSCDFVSRYGGEEFFVVLPETDKEGAISVAENIRKNIEELRINHSFSKVSPYVTISVGVQTVVPTSDMCLKDFVQSADEALYSAKKAGRNRLCCALCGKEFNKF